MGKRISGKKIKQAMEKAFSLGIQEEAFTVGGVSIVLRNLTQPEWQDALAETRELEDEEIVDFIRFALLARSIIEIEEVSFRDVTSIEMDEEDPSGQPIVLEKKDYVTNLMRTWTGEVLQIVYAKFLEVTNIAEEVAKKNVTFRPSDDSPQEELRNLLIRAKEIQGELPFDLAEKILQDTGFREVKLTSTQDTAPPEAPKPQEETPLEPEVKSSPVVPVEPVEPRVPVTVSQKATIPFVGAPPGVPPIPPHVLERQRQLAELEALAGPIQSSPPVQLDLIEAEVPELVEHAVKPNFAEALSAPQQRGGINPRFKQRV